jgi:hypothetical protein
VLARVDRLHEAERRADHDVRGVERIDDELVGPRVASVGARQGRERRRK